VRIARADALGGDLAEHLTLSILLSLLATTRLCCEGRNVLHAVLSGGRFSIIATLAAESGGGKKRKKNTEGEMLR
jgi:hypothetical protein